MTEIKQISESEWDEVAYPLYVATLPFTAEELTQAYGFDVFEYWDDGLGQANACIVSVESSKYWLISHPGGDDPLSNCMAVQVRSFEPDSALALGRLCDALGLELQALLHHAEHLGAASWLLNRLDDNGNEVAMFRFHERQCAELVARRYQARGHKQTYLVSKVL